MKKGFTLLELVVGLVILLIVSIIALITLNKVVDKIRREQADDCIDNYIFVIEKQIIINELNENKIDDFKTGFYTLSDLKEKGVRSKDDMPAEGWVYISDKNVSSYSFLLNGYVISFDGVKYTIEKSSKVKDIPTTVSK